MSFQPDDGERLRGCVELCKLFFTCQREVVQEASQTRFPQTYLNTLDFPFIMVGFDGDSASCVAAV